MSDGFLQFSGRPVFQLPVSWANSPERGILADPRPVQVGFGAEVLEPLQEFTAQDFTVTVHLANACAINALERFFARTYGPLRGFWLPGLETAADLVAVNSAQSYLIAPGSALAANFADRRWEYLWFVPPPGSGLAPQPAKVASVVANSDNDSLTLTAGLTTLPTTEWAICRLHYVRLATNDVKLTFWGDNRARSQLRLIELPPEYTAIELGERPAYLYTFSRAAGEIVPAKTWYRTSFDQHLVIGGHDYLPAPLSHSKLQRTQKGDRDGISLEGWLDGGDNPLALYLPFPPQLKIRVAVDAVRLDALAGEIGNVSTAPERVFAGVVSTATPKGRLLQATCISRLDDLSGQIPRFLIQKTCGHRLYNAATCKVNPAGFRVTGTLAEVDGNSVVLTITGGNGDVAAHWFAQGWIVVCTGEDEEYRAVADSARQDANTQLLTLNSRFSLAVIVGQQFVAYAGCDLKANTCTNKFGNFVNFGGHPKLQNDLGLKTIDQKTNTGGKGGGK